MLTLKRTTNTYLAAAAVILMVPLVVAKREAQRKAEAEAAPALPPGRDPWIRARREQAQEAAATARRNMPRHVGPLALAAVARVDATKLVTPAEAAQLLGEPVLPDPGAVAGRGPRRQTMYTFVGRHSYAAVVVLPQADFEAAADAPTDKYVVKPVSGIGEKVVLLTNRETGNFSARRVGIAEQAAMRSVRTMKYFLAHRVGGAPPGAAIQGPSNTARVRTVAKGVCVDISVRTAGAVPSTATLRALTTVARRAVSRLP